MELWSLLLWLLMFSVWKWRVLSPPSSLIHNCVAAHEPGSPEVLLWSLLSMVGA